MSGTWDHVSQSLAERLGWALFHSLWQGLVVAGTFCLLRFLLRRCSANTRYLTSCAMLALLAAGPLVSLVYGPLGLVDPQKGVGMLGGGSPAGVLSSLGSGGRVADFGQITWFRVQQLADRVQAVLPGVVVVWALGVGFLTCRLAQGCWWVRRVRTVRVKPVDAGWIAVLEYLKCRFDIRQPVRLVESALAEVPMVVGWLKPVILLPTSALAGLSPDQLEAIIAHELAHVRRYDYVVNALQNVVETLMFYHPAVWWISRCIREERELCCDDLVVRVCEDRNIYARALFRLEELRGTPSRLALAASGGSLLQRIRRLMGGSVEARPVTVREFGGLTLVAVGCALVLAGAGLLLGRETYAGTVRIRVEGQHRAVLPPGASPGSTSSYDPYFIQTEFEVLQSQVVLGRVVEKLNLGVEWGKESGRNLRSQEAIEFLRSRLEIRPVRNTSIVEIRVFDADGGQAAGIANAIARTYADYRAGKQERAVGDALDTMLTRLKDQDELVTKARAKVDRLRSELSIPDTATGSEGPSTLLSAETLRKIESLRLDSQAELVRVQTFVATLKALDPNGLAQTLASGGMIQDVLLSQLLEQQTSVEQRLVAMRTEYGPEYSEVLKLASQAEDLRRRIKERVNGDMIGLESRMASLQESLAALSHEVERITRSDVQKANLSQPYFQAKRELEELQHFRSALYLKLAEERTDAALPRGSAVEIVDEAFPPNRPFSPNRPRAVALMAAGFVLAVLGFVVVRAGRESTIPAQIS